MHSSLRSSCTNSPSEADFSMSALLRQTLVVFLLLGSACFTSKAHGQSIGEVTSFQTIGNDLGGLAAGTLNSDDRFGGAAAGIGDLDGDGVPDALVGASGKDAVYVLFMNADGTVRSQQEISDGVGGLPTGTLGSNDAFGSSAVGLGDLDDDGVPDVLVGAATAFGTGIFFVGAAYVLFLNNDGTVKAFERITDNEGGFPDDTLKSFGGFGGAAANLGDVDGDGVTDVLVGASEANDFTGEAFVLLLNTDGTVKAQQRIADGEGGLPAGTLGAFAQFGEGAAGAGDVDGDGVPDVLVGSPEYADDSPNATGTVYVLLLNADGTVRDLQEIADGVGGVPAGTIGSGSGFGSAITALGDVDGDGVADVLVGADDEDEETVSTDAGAVYVHFLNDDGTVKAVQRISEDDGGLPSGTLQSFDEFGAAVATLGDLDGDGGADVLVGAPGASYSSFSDAGVAYALFLSPTATASVTGPGLIPFGASGVSIDFAAGTSGSGTVEVTRFADPPTGTTGIPEGDNVSRYRIVITADAGLTVGSGTEVRFDVSQFGGISDPSTVAIYTRPDPGNGDFTALTPVTVDDGGTPSDISDDALVVSVDGFSEFVLASNDPANPLPVELTAFTATADGADAVLTWQTASETNNAGFHVEQRQPDGTSRQDVSTWKSLGFVEGAGTTTEPQDYRFRVRSAGYGEQAFRLRQVDTDGTESLSDVQTVRITPTEAVAVSAYPNPFGNGQPARITVTPREAQQVTVDVFDMLGRRVARLHDGRLNAGEATTLTLSGAQHASGVYFVRVVGEQFQTTTRLTLVR